MYCDVLFVLVTASTLPVSCDCLSARLSVSKHDFCKKALSNFSVTLGVFWNYGLVVRNVKVSHTHSDSKNI